MLQLTPPRLASRALRAAVARPPGRSSCARRLCEKQRGCNRWVWCHNAATCGQACWLKRTGDAGGDKNVHKGGSILWTSGMVPKDFDINPGALLLGLWTGQASKRRARAATPASALETVVMSRAANAPHRTADTLPPVNTSISRLLIKTKYGTIRITLKPDWSAGSVAYVRRLAAMPELCGAQCQFYRAEPGFLLQVRAWPQQCHGARLAGGRVWS